MQAPKIPGIAWPLIGGLSAAVLFKAYSLRNMRDTIFRGYVSGSRPLHSPIFDVTLRPAFVIPEMMLLMLALAYVLLRRRQGGADEVDVVIGGLMIADFVATLLLFAGERLA